MTSIPEKSFQEIYSDFQDKFDRLAQSRFSQKKSELKAVLEKGSVDTSYHLLVEAMEYSFFSGGKRFRPVMGFAVGRLYGLKEEDVFPWVFAVEMIHTYSLIHDDLPCMDDDDQRRGQPTNHIKYGEAIALLAGDALLTDAFGELARVEQTAALPRLISMISAQAGLYGMITGQVMDIQFEKTWESATDLREKFRVLQQIHHLKTARLIQLSCAGAAVIGSGSDHSVLLAERFGMSLGYAFQIADDLLDAADGEKQNMVSLIGIDKTRELLVDITQECRTYLKELVQVCHMEKNMEAVQFLEQMIVFNGNRKK